MYSYNSYNLLPDKRQSPLGSSVTNSLGLLRKFNNPRTMTTRSCSLFGNMSSQSSVDLKATEGGSSFCHATTKPLGVMSFVCTLGESSRLRPKMNASNLTNGKSKLHGCKEIMTHHSSMTNPFTFASSNLIGGFVGSKSQLGRRPTQGFEVKMWDIIRDLLYLVGNPANLSKKNLLKSTMDRKKTKSLQLKRERNCQIESEIPSALSNTNFNKTEKQHQSYADAARSDLSLEKSFFNSLALQQEGVSVPENYLTKGNSNPLFATKSNDCTTCITSSSSTRDRITSECSADSEDSYIVFEHCDGDEDINISSDEDSVLNLCLTREVSPKDGSIHSRTFCFKESLKPPGKRVRFAEGKSLVQVHPMVKWNYAYRSARRGPWEMLARDSARFRCRIQYTEDILKPVLSAEHREKVYQQRFSS